MINEYSTNSDYSKYHIHIVDDSIVIIKSIIKVLSTKGYTISHTQNGRDALESIAENKPNLIILDISMPVMDGYTTMQHLKKDSKTSKIPVICLTSLTEAEAIRKVFALGASDYLSKPFIDEELLVRIEKEINTIILKQVAEDRMIRLAKAISTDILTKVYNRIHMTSSIDRNMKQIDTYESEKFSLIYLDIDNFNSFNHMHGLKNSDKTLYQFATVLKENMLKNDILSRWEGDRFLILLPNFSKSKLLLRAKSLLNAIETTTFSSGTNITCCATMIEIREKEDIDSIIDKLQLKMQEVKKVMRGSVMMVEE